MSVREMEALVNLSRNRGRCGGENELADLNLKIVKGRHRIRMGDQPDSAGLRECRIRNLQDLFVLEPDFEARALGFNLKLIPPHRRTQFLPFELDIYLNRNFSQLGGRSLDHFEEMQLVIQRA